MTEPKTHTLDVPGAVLHYDVRSNDSSTQPVLLLIGSPMGATGFGTLAGYFADRTVVTYDPRGAERSKRTDDASESTPGEHADDLHRLIAALARHPEQVLIALVSSLHYQHDCAALRAASTRVVLAAGAESGQQIAGRAAAAVIETLPKVLAGCAPRLRRTRHGGVSRSGPRRPRRAPSVPGRGS